MVIGMVATTVAESEDIIQETDTEDKITTTVIDQTTSRELVSGISAGTENGTENV